MPVYDQAGSSRGWLRSLKQQCGADVEQNENIIYVVCDVC